MDLITGHVYRAKKPVRCGFNDVNDRMILHIGLVSVQYDSPSVKNGKHYPSIPIDKFQAWAGEDVTEGYPDGDWAGWRDYLASKKGK